MPTQVRRKAPGSPSVAAKHVRLLADTMLDELGLSDAELSVLLTNDEQIRQLNRDHRNKDRATDVLSFGINRRLLPRGVGPRLLGDIVISLDTAARQAASRARPLLAEIRWLLAHGILHLIGFDHATATQKKRMGNATRRLVRATGLPPAIGTTVPAGNADSLAAVKRRTTRRSSRISGRV